MSDRASRRRRHFLRLIGRAGWNLVDQALSALTNMVLAVLVVKSAGTQAFDAFAVAFLLFSTMIGIERSLVGRVLGVRHAQEIGQVRRDTVSRAMGVVVAITLPAGVVMFGAGLILGGRVGSALAATAVVLPFLVLQDACRLAFIAWAQPHLAALNDALWAVVQFSTMALIIVKGQASATSLVLAWGGAAAVCVLVALIQLRAVPDPFVLPRWLREHRDLVGYLFGDYLLTTGAFNGGYLVVGAIVGDQAVGSIRAAQVLLGPLGIVAGAAMSFGQPELSRRTSSMARAGRRRIAVITAVVMGGLSLGYAGLLLLIPDAAGHLVFAGKWDDAQTVLLPLALAQAAAGSTLGPTMVIYALGQARKTFRLMLIEAPLVFALMIGGTILYGVPGAAWGQLIDQTAMIALWFVTLRQVLAIQDEQPELPLAATPEAPAPA